MQLNSQRPVNLNLLTIKFPSSAIASILHRVSGVITFLLIPFLLWLLDRSLQSAQSYSELQQTLAAPFLKFLVWGFLASFVYHTLAGIRHLLMDCGYFEELTSSQLSAKIVIAMAVLMAIGIGVWIW